jgi:hypothetical protein
MYIPTTYHHPLPPPGTRLNPPRRATAPNPTISGPHTPISATNEVPHEHHVSAASTGPHVPPEHAVSVTARPGKRSATYTVSEDPHRARTEPIEGTQPPSVPLHPRRLQEFSRSRIPNLLTTRNPREAGETTRLIFAPHLQFEAARIHPTGARLGPADPLHLNALRRLQTRVPSLNHLQLPLSPLLLIATPPT